MPLSADEIASDRDSAPLYKQIKDLIRSRVTSGKWPSAHRVPSENELVESLGISRMTANRALRELAEEGMLVRVRGKGSFVADRKRSSRFQAVPNIAAEIVARGGRHEAAVVLCQEEVCGPELADALEIAFGAPAFHTIIVHREDDLPIQLEDRFVNPLVAPDYLVQNFLDLTPNSYLTEIAPIARREQFIEAVNAQPWECRLLAVSKVEPCLLIRRRTWFEQQVVSSVRLLYPGSRHRLESGS